MAAKRPDLCPEKRVLGGGGPLGVHNPGKRSITARLSVDANIIEEQSLTYLASSLIVDLFSAALGLTPQKKCDLVGGRCVWQPWPGGHR